MSGKAWKLFLYSEALKTLPVDHQMAYRSLIFPSFNMIVVQRQFACNSRTIIGWGFCFVSHKCYIICLDWWHFSWPWLFWISQTLNWKNWIVLLHIVGLKEIGTPIFFTESSLTLLLEIMYCICNLQTSWLSANR